MNRVAARSGIVFLLILVLLAGLFFFIFEYVTQAPEWVAFPGSPHLYNGKNIGCGIVKDRNGELLLDMRDTRRYADSEELRAATVHWLGDRNGSVSAPALSAYASQLAGFDMLHGTYSYGNTGGTAQLTLSAPVQMAALEALGDRKGTVGVYNYKTGELLCAVTTPTFDPDNVPEISEGNADLYEGMYINRFVQSRYTPGSIFKIVTLATALESIPDIQQQKFTCTGSYQIGADTVTCTGEHGMQDLKQAFCNSCNCAFAQIAQQLGREALERYVAQFGITQSLSFDGISTVEGNYDLANASQVQIAWSGIGQYTDLLNPCAYMTFVGAIASDGKGVMPYVVKQISSEGVNNYSARVQKGDRLLSTTTAETIREYMGYTVTEKYGAEHFPGMTVCAKTGTAEVGGDKKPNALFTGFVTDDAYPLAFIVVVEDGGYGREICIPIMSQVLQVCKQVLDS